MHLIALRDSHDDHFQAAARSVRLDGDVILQQSEVLHWQAEGAGSMIDIRSVCSCTCQSCVPFQQVNVREREDFTAIAMAHSAKAAAARTEGGGGGRAKSRRFSQSSLLSSSGTRYVRVGGGVDAASLTWGAILSCPE